MWYLHIRNIIFITLSVYIFQEYVFNNWMHSAIVGIIFSIAFILFESLGKLSKHQKLYTKLRSKVGGLDSFDDDGEHLPSLYNFLKNNTSAKLIDKKIYLGSNRTLFERPYRFINDTKNIVERVVNEIDYIKEVPVEKFKKHDAWLFTNETRDKLKKIRYEFYLTNMKNCDARDELVKIYRNEFKNSDFNIKTGSEIKQLAERAERIKNMPDHLNSDLFKNFGKEKV